jgi:hypothetical protein
MYILYYKELYIVKEPLTKNRTLQTWHGKQLAMCEEKEPLENMIAKSRHPERYYIEEQPRK